MFQTIKDVNQSLVDDNLVQTDKIGSGAFFWALPSQGFQSRQNLIDNVARHTEELTKQIEDTQAKIDHERAARETLDGGREQLLRELAAL